MEWERDSYKSFDNTGTDLKNAKFYRNNLDVALKEGVEEFKKLSLEYIINNNLWYIHPNVNLYIDCTSACPCDCEFCIAKTTDNRNGFVDVEVVGYNIKLLENQGIDFTCQITGGEPTLHPELMEIKKICGNRKTVINTNFPSKDLDSFDHINISCHHYNPVIEKKITKFDRDRTLLKNNIKSINEKIRLQCNLIGNYIDTFGEIMQYIAWGYHALSVTSFSFSFLTCLPENILYKQSIIDYIKDKPVVVFNDFIDELESRDHWEFKKYRGGVACYYEVWEYKAYDVPVSVIFKYSDNGILHQLDCEDYYVPDLVIHPNGEMTASWDCRIKKI